jgi:hypothetical protein
MKQANTKKQGSAPDILEDLYYMCASSEIILGALKSGCDVAQLPNGDIIVTQIRVVNTKYKWNEAKKRLIVASSREQ